MIMKNSGLILNHVGEYDQYQRRQAEFEALSKELVDKELELANLQNKLTNFEKTYVQIVGVLLAELDELEMEIAREVLRLYPTEASRKKYRKAERKANASYESVRKKTDKDENKKPVPSKDLKELFRKVAKTIHPDLTTNEEEREYRTILMAKANEAYRNGDHETLEKILHEWEQEVDSCSFKDNGLSEMDQLEKKIRQIKIHLIEIDQRIMELKTSDLYLLMLKVEEAWQNGYDLLHEMANNIQQQIHDTRIRLNRLKPREA
jgi:hypothetical protein